MSKNIAELSAQLNEAAVQAYPVLLQVVDRASRALDGIDLYNMHMDAPYPYHLYEGDSLVTTGPEKTFGKVVQATRMEGLRKIHSNIATQDKEHAWMYIADHSLWVDTTLAANKLTVNPDRYIEKFLSRMFEYTEAVHTHPDGSVDTARTEFPEEYSDNYLYEAALPSVADLLRHSHNARTSGSYGVTSSVVSHYGITNYALIGSDVLASLFSLEGFNRHIAEIDDKPTEAIRRKLGELSAHAILIRSADPAFTFRFEQL